MLYYKKKPCIMKNNINNLTLKEYLNIVNDEHKLLPSSAFGNNVEEYSFENPFDKIIKKFNRYGIDFSLREQKTDRWKNAHNYPKRDDDDEILRDENNNIIYHDEQTIQSLISEDKRYVYEHAIYDETHGKMAARTQDEWGCLLIRTASAYEGLGLGEELLYEHRKVRPFRNTGGYSPQGLNCEQKAFRRLVLDNIENGVYDDLASERREEIISSVSNITTFKERYEKESNKEKYDFSQSSDLLYHVEERFVLIYNQKLYEMLADEDVDIYSDRSQMLLKDGVAAYIDLLGNPESDRIFKSYFKDEKHLEEALKLLSDVNETTRFEVYKRDQNMFSKLPTVSMSEKRDFCELTLSHNLSNDYQIKNAVSKKIKKMIDPYEEKWSIIHEVADSLADENMSKNDEIYENNFKNNKKIKSKIKP